MVIQFLFLFGLLVIQGGHGWSLQNEPNSQAQTASGDHNEELAELKKLIMHVSEKMDRWDAFYMGRLEPRMIGAATSLANLDANVKHLQERAHIWDTFQLHVSAWNDQIKTLDRKLDIINKGQQKIESLESKMISLVQDNDSLPSLLNKLNALEDKLDSFSNGIPGKDVQQPIFNEFAGRGMLHTVKNLERKLDRLQINLDRLLRSGRAKPKEESVEDAQTSKVVEDLLKDIAYKVDVMYDKSSFDGDVENHIDTEADDNEIRHLGKTCKRLVAPFKKLLSNMEALRDTVNGMAATEVIAPSSMRLQRKSSPLKNSVLEDIKESLENIEEEIESLREKNEKNINENERILKKIEKKLDSELEDDEEDDKSLKKTLKNLIIDQREQLEDFIKKNVLKLQKEIDELEDDIEDLDDDDDDDDDNDKSDKKKNDSDDDDDDDDDDDNSRRKSRRKNNKSDDDDDDDDDDSDDKSKRRHKSKDDSDDDDDNDKNDTDEDDDDDDDDSDDNGKKHSRRRNKNRSDDDDDDDDSDDKPRRRKSKHNKNDSDDDDDSDDKPRRRKSKHNKNDSDDDSDDDDTKEKKSRKDCDDSSSSSSSSSDDTKEDKSKNGKDDDDDDDDDNDSDNTKENKSGKRKSKKDSDEDDDKQSKKKDLTLDPSKATAEKSVKVKDVEQISKHDAAENLAADGPSSANILSSLFGIPSSGATPQNAAIVKDQEAKGRK